MIALKKLGLVMVLSLIGGIGADAFAQSLLFLDRGTKVVACPGASRDAPLKAGIRMGSDLLVTGLIMCREDGDAYRLRFDFLKVMVNPRQRPSIRRDKLTFDWLGLSLYRPSAGGDRLIEWLFDDAQPINGTLSRDGDGRLVFGDLEFLVPKSAIENATNMTFFLTAEGLLFPFPML